MRRICFILGLSLFVTNCRESVPGACTRDDQCPTRSRCADEAGVCVKEYEEFELLQIGTPVFVRRGETVSIPITFQRTDRVRLPIAIEIGPVPATLTATGATVQPDQTSALLTLKAGKETPLGPYPMTVTATAGDTRRTQAVELNVSDTIAPLWDAMNWDQANWN